LLAVAPAAQADRAARLVDEERIARELRHVLVDQIEAARRVASDERVERLDVLPLAPRRPGHGSARRLGGRARRRGVALDDGHQRDAAVSQRQSFVGFHGRREARLGAGTERQQSVHAFLEPLGRDGRGGGDASSKRPALSPGAVSILASRCPSPTATGCPSPPPRPSRPSGSRKAWTGCCRSVPAPRRASRRPWKPTKDWRWLTAAARWWPSSRATPRRRARPPRRRAEPWPGRRGASGSTSRRSTRSSEATRRAASIWSTSTWRSSRAMRSSSTRRAARSAWAAGATASS